jgi:hypothetical protein
MDGQEAMGWFDVSNYRSDGPTFKALAEFCRLAHANGTRTFIALVPERSDYRAKLPPNNAFHLTHTLRDFLGEAAPTVLDFRSSAPDDDFRNVNHLNAKGRARMTNRLSQALKPYLE